MRTIIAFVSAVAFILGAAVAEAQPQDADAGAPALPPSPQPQQTTPPDIVVTHDGGMVRGTIQELVPGSHVVITLSSGEARRFASSDVRYAGLATEWEASRAVSAAPPATEPTQPADARPPNAVAVRADTVNVEFVSDDHEPPAFHLQSHSARLERHAALGFERLCVAPCTATIQSGSHVFGLSRGTETPIPADDPVIIERDAIVRGQYVSRSGERAVGLAFFLLAAASPLAFLLPADRGDATPLLVFIGVGVVGVGIGMVLTQMKDRAIVTVEPRTH